MLLLQERKCMCGDEESFHIDNDAECVIVGCGCSAFEEKCEFCGGDGVKREVEEGTGAVVEVAGEECVCQF